MSEYLSRCLDSCIMHCCVFTSTVGLIIHMTVPYVCMSENLYPARLKQKSHSCAAVLNKQ